MQIWHNPQEAFRGIFSKFDLETFPKRIVEKKYAAICAESVTTLTRLQPSLYFRHHNYALQPTMI